MHPSLVVRLLCCLGLSIMLATATGCVDKPTECRVRAMALFKADQHDEALKACDEGLKVAPENVALHIIQGKALFELGRIDEAGEAYESALKYGAKRPASELTEALLGLGMVALQKKNWSTAKARFVALSEANPKDGRAQLNLARICLQMKDLPCALKHGEQAGRMRGRSEDVLFTLGRIYLVAKKYEEADKTFSRICEVVKKAASCPYGRALVAAQRGDTKAALVQLKLAVDRKLPNPAELTNDPLFAPIAKEPAFIELANKAAR
ncbi:MAG: tetratricopeptide repeat protein [Polyangiaceae bacterium]